MKQRGCLGVVAVIFVNIISISAKQHGSLTFVIDNTASMGSEIRQVKEGANEIMNIILNEKKSQVQDIVLVTFNDPDGSPVVHEKSKLRIKTDDRNSLNAALNSIIVTAGGDCPEYSMDGMYRALAESHTNSFVFVFTDASPKDFELTNNVKKLAQEKSCQVFFFLTKAPSYCLYRDPFENFVYYNEIANATSGQVFHLEKAQINEILSYIRFTIDGDQALIDSETFPANEEGFVNFTVDDQTEYVLISTSGTDVILQLTDGPTRNYDIVTWIEHAKAIKLINPQPGSYIVRVKSGSVTTVMIYGKTDFTFKHGFSLSEASSLEGTKTQPTDGLQHHLAISVEDPRHTVNIQTVRILDMKRNVQKTLILRQKYKDFYTTDAFVPPSTMFMIEVEGEGIESHKPITRKAKIPIEPLKRLIAPVITIAGSSRSYDFNSKVSLECRVTAYPNPIIVWKDDRGNVVPSKNYALNTYEYISQLTISKVKRTHTYQCQASNRLGEDIQNVAVPVPSPFIVHEVPKATTTVEYEKEAVLNCNIKSSFPIQIRWLRVVGAREEQIIDSHKYSISSDGSQLKINKMGVDLEGKYFCKAVLIEDASFELKYGTQVVILKIVPTITSIDQTPGSHNFNSDLLLTCKVRAYPKPSIVWKDGAGNTLQSEISALNAYESVSKLNLANVKRSQNYYCEAKNFAGTVHQSIGVAVKSPFSVYEVPKDRTNVEYGKEAILHCNIKSSFPIKIHWLRAVGAKVEEIRDSDKYSISSDGSQLKIIEMKVDQQGKYECKAILTEDESFEVKYETEVKIPGLEVPQIEKQPSSIKTKEAKTISIKCKILKSHPKAVIIWHVTKNGVTKILRKNTEELAISSTTLDDAGKYKCIATNDVGQAEQTVELVIEAPPKIISSNENAYTAVTSDVALRIPCKVTGYPKPTITWRVNNSVVVTGDKYDIDGGDLINSQLSENDDYNNYTCRAENVFGVDEKTFNAVVTTKIPEEDMDNASIIYILEGKSRTISCRHSKSETVKWYKEGVYTVTGTLAINNAKTENAGNYSCRVSSRLETRTQNYVVDVGHPPIFQNNYSNKTSVLDWDGGMLRLDCKIDYQPPTRTVTVQWKYNGRTLHGHSEELEVIGWGNYTCRISNNYGAIETRFQVTSTGCLVHKNPKIANTPLLLDDGKTIAPNFGTTDQYLVLKSSENIHMYCHDQSKRHNSFQMFPDKNNIVAKCEREDQFLVGDKVYNFADLKCKNEVLPNFQYTGQECWNENSEMIKVNYDVDGGSRDVYEVCFNKVEKVPIYTKVVIQPLALGVAPEASWHTYSEFGVDDEAKYNCAKDSKCCFAKTQLVTALDVTYGPAQTATFINHLNSVPYWSQCDNLSKTTTSLKKVDSAIREGLFENSELTVFSGTNNYTDKGGLIVPRYIWKVIKTQQGEVGVLVYVNDPSPTTEDILCKEHCEQPFFLSNIFNQFTYPCCLSEFHIKFGIPQKTFEEMSADISA